MNAETEAMLKRLRNVFPDPGFPGFVPECTCYECQELAAYCRKHPHWTKWTAVDCFHCHAVSLMDGAFNYFLPAYIAAMYVDHETADVAVEHSAWQFLDGGPDLRRFAEIDTSQQELILEWLTDYARKWSFDERQESRYLRQIEALRLEMKDRVNWASDEGGHPGSG